MKIKINKIEEIELSEREEIRKRSNSERMKKWRSNPINYAKEQSRRKKLRDSNIVKVKEIEREYYIANRNHILKRCKEYQLKNPDVKKRSHERAKKQGKGIAKGKLERKKLKPAYIAAQIRKGKSTKSVEQKQAEILIYRLKKIGNAL